VTLSNSNRGINHDRAFTMTASSRAASKERVLTAIALSQPDRVPLDLHGNRWVLERLHRDLGTPTHRALLERLHCDIVDLRGVVDPQYCGPVPQSRELGDGVRENFWGWRQKIIPSASGPEDCFVQFVLADAASIDDVQRHRWPLADWFDFSELAAGLDEWQDFAVMASGASVFQHATFLRGIDNLLMDMALRPELAHWLIDRCTQFYLEFFDRMLTAAAGRIDILRAADDLGTQRGLFLSPDMFRTFIKPRLQQLVELAHRHDVKFLFHSCGAIRPLIDDLIEIGVDVLDPLQAAAEGMQPQALKDAYGRRICLHGGICTQYLLPQGTPEDVRREVRRRLETLGRDGGYILAPCHVLQTDVPTENILALVDAVLEFGQYA
jgi:uroporphyrinogen decarboxylase